MKNIWRWVRLAWSHRSAAAYLDARCMDWSIHYRDFPRNRVSAHYEVWAIRFFVCAKGIGRSPMEAAKRAVRVLDVRSARFHRENCATDEDMSRI